MKRKILTISLILCAIACSAIAVTVTAGAGAEEWDREAIKEMYAYGDTFEIPDCTLTVGGSSVKALSTVAYPNGKVVRGKSVYLNEMGNYTLRYYAALGNKQYSLEEIFRVDGLGYRTNSADSTVVFDKYTRFGADSEGLLVNLANGDELTFTKLIDISALSQKDAIVKFFITPEHQGTADFNKLTFTLTDSADSSKYIRFDVNRSQFSGNGLGISWVMAGGNGQDMVGLEKGKKLHVNNDIGTAMYISFVAQDNSGGWSGPSRNTKPDLRYGMISFDYTTKSVYANSDIVADLDSSDYYKDLWSGMTSNKARLTVSAGGYSGSTANFCLTEIFGMTTDELKYNAFSDDGKPEITVDSDYEIMPKAKIGKAYPVPQATAYDDYAGDLDVMTEVIYGYNTDSPVSVSVIDGKFTPERMGSYTIVYSAKDGFGNKCEKFLFVQAAVEIPEIEISVPALPADVELGTLVDVPMPKVVGGSGKTTIETAVLFDGERTIIEKGFRPENQGEYTIEYTATDYIGTKKTATFVINAHKGEKPLFIDQAFLPPVYISGGRYVLPELYANDYTSGRLERVLCDVKVNDAGGEKIYKSGSEFVPVVNDGGETVGITYYTGNANYPVFNIPVIIGREDNKVFMSNYLYGTDVTVTSRDEEDALYKTGLAVIPADGTAGWTFANALLAEKASVTVGTLSGKTNFGAFVFTITDSVNGRRISVTADIGASKIVFSHGNAKYTVGTSIKSGGKLSVSYENGKVTAVCNDTAVISVPVTEYDDGGSFEGFTSSKIYIGVYTTENKGNSRYMVLSVCENTLSYRNQDNNAPSFGILGDYGGKFSVNSDYVINRGVCSDVFAPESKAELVVIAPDGSVVKDINGKTLQSVGVDEEYVIRLTQYGKYTLSYTISEVNWVGKSKKFNVTVSVTDEQPPVIQFVGGGVTEASVGDVIVIPEYKVSDNLSSGDEITVRIFVVNAQGKFIELKDGANAIKCEYSGKYTFIVYAVDAAGNSSSLSHSVNVR